MKKFLVIILMFIGFGCSHQPSEMDIRSTITGVWSAQYNPRITVNLVCDTPYIKSHWCTDKIEILSVDRGQKLVRFKKSTGGNGMFKLEEMDNGKYYMLWKFDNTAVYPCSFISKIY